jgi:hypothetical protein
MQIKKALKAPKKQKCPKIENCIVKKYWISPNVDVILITLLSVKVSSVTGALRTQTLIHSHSQIVNLFPPLFLQQYVDSPSIFFFPL